MHLVVVVTPGVHLRVFQEQIQDPTGDPKLDLVLHQYHRQDLVPTQGALHKAHRLHNPDHMVEVVARVLQRVVQPRDLIPGAKEVATPGVSRLPLPLQGHWVVFVVETVLSVPARRRRLVLDRTHLYFLISDSKTMYL